MTACFCANFQVPPIISVDCSDLQVNNFSPYWNKKHCCQEAATQTLPELCGEINATTLGKKSHVPGCTCIDFMACKTVVLTATSTNHYWESLDAIASVQNMMPDVKIIMMDLGMWKSQRNQIQRLRNVEVISFPFEAFPPHVKKLDTYAWKHLSIQMMLSKYEIVSYMDASVRLTRPLVDLLLPDLQKFPLRVYVNGFFDGAYTMDETYDYLGVTRKQMSKRYQKEGTFQLYRNCSLLHERILSPLVDCALHKECIAPAGGSPYYCSAEKYQEQVQDIDNIDVIENVGYMYGCHRYDQSAITCVLEREFQIPNDSPLVEAARVSETRVIWRYVSKCFTLYLDY